VILIPVKDQTNAKERLAKILVPAERRALAQAMLQDVLDAVMEAASPATISLVTHDAYAEELAEKFGLGVIDDGDAASETDAIEKATADCVRREAAWTLVIPADAPLVTPEEIVRIFKSAPEKGSVLVTDHGRKGSNAVYRSPGNLFPLKFGDYSYAPHLRAAQQTGLPVQQLMLPGIALDVDRPDDAGRVMSSPGETRAQRLLRALRVDIRLRKMAAAT
jgi:2-phospho-L-lactate/phosphoenolpyruvate guanylyltransferase